MLQYNPKKEESMTDEPKFKQYLVKMKSNDTVFLVLKERTNSGGEKVLHLSSSRDNWSSPVPKTGCEPFTPRDLLFEECVVLRFLRNEKKNDLNAVMIEEMHNYPCNKASLILQALAKDGFVTLQDDINEKPEFMRYSTSWMMRPFIDEQIKKNS